MKKMFAGWAVVACALALVACGPNSEPVNSASNTTVEAPPGPSGAIVEPVSTALTLKLDKAMWTAEASYNVPAAAYVSADTRGALPAGLKAKVKPLLLAHYQGLVAARKLRCVATYLTPGEACVPNITKLEAARDAMNIGRDAILKLLPAEDVAGALSSANK